MLCDPAEYRKHTGGMPFSVELMEKLMNELEPGDLDVSAHAGKNSVKDLTWLGSLSPHAQAVLIDKSASLQIQCHVTCQIVLLMYARWRFPS